MLAFLIINLFLVSYMAFNPCALLELLIFRYFRWRCRWSPCNLSRLSWMCVTRRVSVWCVCSCRRRGIERVKTDGATVLSVLLGAVPASAFSSSCLRPSARRGEAEHRAGAWVCVAVCHSGRTHFNEKQPLSARDLLLPCRVVLFV